MSNIFDFSKTFIGVVEDRNDPMKLGRCRVRIFGYHSESKDLLPTKHLPWAIPIQPITSAAISGIGQSPIGPLPGTYVVGFFLDGDDMQQPAIFGTIAGNPSGSFEPVANRPMTENKDLKVIKDKEGNPIIDSEGNRMTSGRHGVDGWQLGQTSEKYESGGRGAGTINDYMRSNDYGGASYGTYQFASYLPSTMPNGTVRPSSKSSPVLTFINNSRFKERFRGLTPATPEFDSTWRSVAKETQNQDRSKDTFFMDQHDFIQRTYYNPCIANIQRNGIDLTKFGCSVQDLVWSTAVQLGPANVKVFTEPLRGMSQLTDVEIVKSVSQYKINNVEKLFKSSSQAIRNSVVNRWKQEEKDLLELAKK